MIIPYDPILDLRDYKYPTLELLNKNANTDREVVTRYMEFCKDIILNVLKQHNIFLKKISLAEGPTLLIYEIFLPPGVTIARVKNLKDEFALNLKVTNIQIQSILDKGCVGIEIPNIYKEFVRLRTLLSSDLFIKSDYALPIAIGKRMNNENFIVDLAAIPNLLIAGSTGQGKSVCIDSIILSLLYTKHPSQLKLVLIDPKKVELNVYHKIEKHFLAKLPGERDIIVSDSTKIINTLIALCREMDTRYDLMKAAQVKNIIEYNKKFINRLLNPEFGHQYLPFIVLIISEFADFIGNFGKEVETPMAHLAQLSRSVGIHLIIVTQRPSINVISGSIKANFDARIAFRVPMQTDSRAILDIEGAEKLSGNGDMIASFNGEKIRLQGAYVNTDEVEKVVTFISNQRGYAEAFLLPDTGSVEKDFDINDKDSLFEDAARLIVNCQVGSTSLLQRRMKIGYNRSSRLMDQLEASGIVGPTQNNSLREVYIKTEQDLIEHLEK